MRVGHIKANITECKQGGVSIIEFYSKLSGLWSELDNHARVPTCMCSGCTCKGYECNVTSGII